MHSLERAALVKGMILTGAISFSPGKSFFLNHYPCGCASSSLCEIWRLTLMTERVAFLWSMAPSLSIFLVPTAAHSSVFLCFTHSSFPVLPGAWGLEASITLPVFSKCSPKLAASASSSVVGRMMTFQRGLYPNPWNLWVC